MAIAGGTAEGIKHRLDSGGCDLEHGASFAVCSSRARGAVEITITALDQLAFRLGAIAEGESLECIKHRLDSGGRDLEHGAAAATVRSSGVRGAVQIAVAPLDHPGIRPIAVGTAAKGVEPPLLDELDDELELPEEEPPLDPDDDAPLDPLEELLDELDEDEPLELLEDEEPVGLPDESLPPQLDINKITPRAIIEVSKRRMVTPQFEHNEECRDSWRNSCTRTIVKFISTHAVMCGLISHSRMSSMNTSDSFCEYITRRRRQIRAT